MVATLEKLRQDIITLESKTAEVANELRNVVVPYCDVLKTSVQRQLVLASFHLCTQTYPEAFLRLSFSERGQLQQKIQQLGQQLAAELMQSGQVLLDTELEGRVDPTILLEHWQQVEQGFIETLRAYSRHINEQFQTSGILNVSSLAKLLDIATTAERSGRSITNPPLLLKALVDSKDSAELAPEPVVALYLQLGDLEFTDPELMGWRQKLRPLIQNLTQLEQVHAQKQEELLVAEAIAAWKSSWVVQSDEPTPEQRGDGDLG